MIYEFDDAIAFMKSTLEDKVRNNPGYSLRAFAKKLCLSPGSLSLILSRKKKLSSERALEIAGHLELNSQEKQYFILLIQLEKAKSPALRMQHLEDLKKLNPKIGETADMKQSLLALEHFKLIAEWYGLAVLELVSAVAGKWTATAIAKKLGLTKIEAELMLDRLVRLELIQETGEGRYRRCVSTVLVDSKLPNEALKKYYEGLHLQSAKSVRSQTPREKVIGSQVFAIDPAQLEEVRKATDSYLNQINAIAMKAKNKTEIYQALTNVFRLSTKEINI